MLPLKDVIPPRRFPQLSTGIVMAATTALPLLWWRHWLDRVGAFYFLINLLYLCVFADNVEDRLGRGRFAAVYLAGHAAGTLTTIMIDSHAALAMGLTSPAVAAIMGAYVGLYPNSRVLLFAPLPWDVHELPALFFVSLYFILHVPGALLALGPAFVGCLAGAGLCLVLKRPYPWIPDP